MKKIIFSLIIISSLLFACNGPIDQPSDEELEEMIAEQFEKEMGGTLNFFSLFSKNKEGNKIIELERLENLKRADWKDGKQKFKADAVISFMKGINLPEIDFEGTFSEGEVEMEFDKIGGEMTREIQGYLFKDEFDDWVVEFVD